MFACLSVRAFHQGEQQQALRSYVACIECLEQQYGKHYPGLVSALASTHCRLSASVLLILFSSPGRFLILTCCRALQIPDSRCVIRAGFRMRWLSINAHGNCARVRDTCCVSLCFVSCLEIYPVLHLFLFVCAGVLGAEQDRLHAADIYHNLGYVFKYCSYLWCYFGFFRAQQFISVLISNVHPIRFV